MTASNGKTIYVRLNENEAANPNVTQHLAELDSPMLNRILVELAIEANKLQERTGREQNIAKTLSQLGLKWKMGISGLAGKATDNPPADFSNDTSVAADTPPAPQKPTESYENTEDVSDSQDIADADEMSLDSVALELGDFSSFFQTGT